MTRKAVVKAISTHLPEKRITNEQLAEEFPEWDVEKIFDKTGVSVRHSTTSGECASDLGVAAARKLADSGAYQPGDIDFLLFCTQSPDYFLPTTACIMQRRLGLPETCGALDYNLGCSGFVYGLALAKGLIETDLAENVLLITAETYTKYIHPQDRSVRTIFGDGAAVSLISAVDTNLDMIGPFVFGTDGTGAENLIVRAGGMRNRHRQETAIKRDGSTNGTMSDENLYMNGPEIFNFTLKTVPAAVNGLLEKSGLALDDVDMYVFHQANRFMLETLRRKIGIPETKFCMNMEEYGNTVSATVPMALQIAIDKGEIQPGQRIMVVGFGVGYSWAAALITLI